MYFPFISQKNEISSKHSEKIFESSSPSSFLSPFPVFLHHAWVDPSNCVCKTGLQYWSTENCKLDEEARPPRFSPLWLKSISDKQDTLHSRISILWNEYNINSIKRIGINWCVFKPRASTSCCCSCCQVRIHVCRSKGVGEMMQVSSFAEMTVLHLD